MAKMKSYFGGVIKGIKSLLTGMDVTMGEYITPKVTEQYPENRKTQHVAERHRGTLIMPHDENGKNKCTACTLCEKACPNGTIKIKSTMITTAEGRKKKLLLDYQYDLGDCMFCQLCVNACNFDAIKFVKDFEQAVFDRNTLVEHLNIPPSAEELEQYEKNAKAAAEKAAAAAKAKKEAEEAAKKADADKADSKPSTAEDIKKDKE
jgi:NADH-quinone oxidoreductase subunit I